MTAREHVLLLSCPDRPGIVAAVTATLAAHDANIEDSQQYKDSGTGRFFMRIHFTDPTGEADWHALLEPAAAAYAMEWDVRPAAQRCRTLILVSKFGHCLNDLLFRWRSGALTMDIPAVVSNHRDLEPLVTSYGIPFHHVPVTADTKDRRRRPACARSSPSTTSTSSCWPATCRCSPTTCHVTCPAGSSTSTTRSCRRSRAPSPITRRIDAGREARRCDGALRDG
jgi:formyltetrahydrofolate hydrolase